MYIYFLICTFQENFNEFSVQSAGFHSILEFLVAKPIMEYLIILTHVHLDESFRHYLIPVCWFLQRVCQCFYPFSTGKGCPSLDSSLLELTKTREKTSSYLYTTELTSSFAKKSSEVHDSLLQYRQPVKDTRPRPCSMPDETNLGKQRIAATTGSEILQNFSSPDLSAQRRKAVSTKLIKSFRKKKPSVESFKSYVDLDLSDQNSEAGSENSSSGVFQPAISTAELTTAVSTKVEPRSSKCEALATNSCSSRYGKTDSLSPNNEKDFSVAVPGPSENSDSIHGSRVAPGIADLRRRLGKSPQTSARTLPPTLSKPKDNSKGSPVGSTSLPRPELQNEHQWPRPESYLLAMDSVGNRPLIQKQQRSGNGFPNKWDPVYPARDFVKVKIICFSFVFRFLLPVWDSSWDVLRRSQLQPVGLGDWDILHKKETKWYICGQSTVVTVCFVSSFNFL